MRTPHRPRLSRLPFLCLVPLILIVPTASLGREQQDSSERQRAFQLYKEARFTEALPAFEKLSTAQPEDVEVVELYGFLILNQHITLKDAAARKDARRHGREVLLRARKLGANAPLLQWYLSNIPVDGGEDDSFSTRKEVNDTMQTAEKAFVSGHFKKAIESYQQALLLDPTLYEATLYIGDSYFRLAEQSKAGEWFARAVALNPDRETAYRYWGESLIKQGRLTEAGDKFIEAYLAEPYSRLVRSGFLSWGERAHLNLDHPQVEIPASVTPQENGQLSIGLDVNTLKKKSGAGAAWMTYGLTRAAWSQGEFAKNYPDEIKYRHSLKEEAAALRAAVKVLNNNKSDRNKTDPSLQIIAKLDHEGLLEAFILLGLPDAGISRDFPEYRRTGIAHLRRYVNQYVLNGGVGE